MWPFFAAWLQRYEGQSLLLNIGMAMFISKKQQQQQQQQNKTNKQKNQQKKTAQQLSKPNLYQYALKYIEPFLLAVINNTSCGSFSQTGCLENSDSAEVVNL